jgi:threonine aldolase
VPVDLRSDTVTRPTEEMRRAMASAEVGDDQYGEDPTVRALEEAFAARLGKEAALYVPSGTMANQLALRVLTAPGDAVVAGASSHVVAYEHGAGARNAGVLFTCSDDGDGTIAEDVVGQAIAGAAHHLPGVGLVCLEDTHMASGGRVWPGSTLDAVAGRARGDGIPVHLDGARLWNAEVASGVEVAARARSATTVMCCLSKGLCAPVGSVLAGPADVIAAAREERHRMGGAMRQAGVIAAAGLVALGMVERLAGDHRRATRLAEAVDRRWPGAVRGPVETNVVVFERPDADRVVAHLEGEGVRVGTIGPGVVRMVTHRDVDDEGVARAVEALASIP